MPHLKKVDLETFDVPEETQQPTPTVLNINHITERPTTSFDLHDVTERPTTSYDLHDATERPTTSFDHAEDTQEPTPTALNIRDVTHGPTPSTFIDHTRNPTPTNLYVVATTSSPTSTVIEPSLEPTFQATFGPTLQPITSFPTPSSIQLTMSPTFEPSFEPTSTAYPTPSAYLILSPTISPTTASPTYQSADSSLEVAIISVFSLSVVCFIAIIVFCFYCAGGDKKTRGMTNDAEDSEEAPIRPTSSSSSPPSLLGGATLGYGAVEEHAGPAAALNAVLQKGIQLHTTKGPKKIKMEITGHTLTMAGTKRFVVNLSDISYVEEGCKTYTFKNSVRARPDELCLSLVLQSTTVDLEAESAEDRDVLVENFNKIKFKLDENTRGSTEGSSNESAL